MSFAGVCEKNQLEFELFWCVYGRDETRKKKSREERRGERKRASGRGEGVATGQEKEKGGHTRND